MGVRGLTTFIAKYGDKCMHDYELNNCYLVIDGNNLAVQLFRLQSKRNDCFGGDYDSYAQTVRTFFENLKKCGITPLVVFDGCYENRKLKTICDRVRDRVASMKSLNASAEVSARIFPLFLRELFTDLLIALECKVVRCEFEADYDMACLARTLNCPLLSYDSDFYIFDVLYIPFDTLDLTPRVKKNADDKVYHCLECKLYQIDAFLQIVGGLEKSVLPLLATVVGNDYIASSVFKEFYAQLKLVKKKKVESEQQRKIESVIRWLANETFQSAATKILSRVKRSQRSKLAEQIQQVANGYNCVESDLLAHFNIHVENNHAGNTENISHIDLSSIADFERDLEFLEGEDLDLKTNFPEWVMHECRNCNLPSCFMDIAVHNRYFCIPQLENFDKVHSHAQSLKILAALHKILRSGCNEQQSNETQLTYIAREGHNYIQSTVLPFCDLQLPTLVEIPGMTSAELIRHLHAILEMDNDEKLVQFLNAFDGEWKLFILSILYWTKTSDEVCKMHVYALILCAITLRTVDKRIGYTRTIRDVNRKLKKGVHHLQSLHFIQQMIPYFYIQEKIARNPRAFDVNIVDTFSRFQSVLFHIKYVNKLLLSPYEDFLISDFYNGTFVYNVYQTLKRRTDPLSYLKQFCNQSMEIFEKFLQISIEIINKMENLQEGNKPQRKRKNRQKSSNSNKAEPKRNVSDASTSEFDPNNPYSVLTALE